MAESRAKSGMGGKSGKKSSKKSGRIHETHIRHYPHGGHEVTHHYKNEDGSVTPGDPDMMADKASLMANLQNTIPDNGSAQAAPAVSPQAAPAGPAPATAAPQGM
jgi:hypothetical protein